MKLLIEIDEKTFKDFHESVVINIGRSSGKTIIEKCLKAISKGTPIHDNATNGDLIEAMFPKAEIEENDVTNTFGIVWEKTEHLTIYIATFARVWWDAPYRAESEEACQEKDGRLF